VFDEKGELFKLFGVNQVPTIILIDEMGKVSLKSSIQDEDFNQSLRTISSVN
jgi:thioredoxin-related protein